MVENVSLPKKNIVFSPILVDYSKKECQRILRRLELEAYAKIVTVFRAQGPLTLEKRKTLSELQRLLSIASDRHKAEVRRALNDEELATVCESICGKEVDDDWILEGKRIAPLLNRGIPQTAFLPRANILAAKQTILNQKLSLSYATVRDSSKCFPNQSCDVKDGKINSNFLESTNLHDTEEAMTHNSVLVIKPNSTTNIVPEASIEVTCEANAPKLTSKTDLHLSDNTFHNILPTQPAFSNNNSLAYSDKNETLSRTLSSCKPLPSAVTEFNDDRIVYSVALPSTHSIPTFNNSSRLMEGSELHRIVSSSTEANRLIQSSQEYQALSRKRVYPTLPHHITTTLDGKLHNDHLSSPVSQLTNGLANSNVPQSRGLIIKQNVQNLSYCLPSPGVQLTQFHSIKNPGNSLINRMPQSFNAVVASGENQPLTATPQLTQSRSIMKTYHPSIQQTPNKSQHQTISYTNIASGLSTSDTTSMTHLSASSILADNKKHSVMLQQTSNTATSGTNVIVVHRAASGRFLTTGTASVLHGGINYTCTPPVMQPVSSANNRQLRILSVPGSVISTASFVTPTCITSSSIQQMHQYTHTQGQSLTGIHTSDSLTFEKPSILDLPTTSANVINLPALLRSSSSISASSSNKILMTQSGGSLSIRSHFHNQPSETSVSLINNTLESKRPRLAFLPSSRQI